MKHLDQRIYAGTALVAAVATAGVLYATTPVDLRVIGSANAATRAGAPVVTWKGLPNVIMHDAVNDGRARDATR